MRKSNGAKTGGRRKYRYCKQRHEKSQRRMAKTKKDKAKQKDGGRGNTMVWERMAEENSNRKQVSKASKTATK